MGGRREGFRAVSFGGEERVVADVRLRGPARVGRYGVDLAAIDALVDLTLTVSSEIDLYLVDEIGKMECLSPRFVAAMRPLLDSPRPVIATVGQRGGGFIAEVKRRKDASLLEVTRANRDSVPAHALRWLEGLRA